MPPTVSAEELLVAELVPYPRRPWAGRRSRSSSSRRDPPNSPCQPGFRLLSSPPCEPRTRGPPDGFGKFDHASLGREARRVPLRLLLPLRVPGQHPDRGALAADRRELVWRPFLLGGVFRAIGRRRVPILGPARARLNLLDMHRWADHFGVPLVMPEGHPNRTVLALRAALAAGDASRASEPRPLPRLLGARPRRLPPEVVREALDEAGLDGAALVARAEDQASRTTSAPAPTRLSPAASSAPHVLRHEGRRPEHSGGKTGSASSRRRWAATLPPVAPARPAAGPGGVVLLRRLEPLRLPGLHAESRPWPGAPARPCGGGPSSSAGSSRPSARPDVPLFAMPAPKRALTAPT